MCVVFFASVGCYVKCEYYVNYRSNTLYKAVVSCIITMFGCRVGVY